MAERGGDEGVVAGSAGSLSHADKRRAAVWCCGRQTGDGRESEAWWWRWKDTGEKSYLKM